MHFDFPWVSQVQNIRVYIRVFPPDLTEDIIQLISQAECYSSWLIFLCEIDGVPL